MSTHRTITGFGNTVLASTSTGTTWTGAWQQCGPFLANRCAIQASFGGSSNGQSVKLEGVLTTTSTAVVVIAQRKSSQKGTQIMSTVSNQLINWVRGHSTLMKANTVVKLYFSAIA